MTSFLLLLLLVLLLLPTSIARWEGESVVDKQGSVEERNLSRRQLIDPRRSKYMPNRNYNPSVNSFPNHKQQLYYRQKHPKVFQANLTITPADNVPREKTGKKAIVTLLCGLNSNQISSYVNYLRVFAYSLRRTGYIGEVLILHNHEFPLESIRALISRFNLKTQAVNRVSVPDRGQYTHLLTKLHIWQLIEYDQVIYYDVDVMFQHNPITAFGDCGEETTFCAVHDQGIHEFGVDGRLGITDKEYFNAGFLVILPDKRLYKELMSHADEAQDYHFLEQDLLNKLFARKWKRLKKEYNMMRPINQDEVNAEAIAIHEKLHLVQRKFQDKKYVWNHNIKKQ
jgi:hypothetical protein